MDPHIVTVFGATGFLGRRIVRRLHGLGFIVRIASRHPGRGREMFGNDPNLQAIAGDIPDTRSVIDAIAGVHGVVNVVSLYTESRRETFHAVHVEYAARVAMEVNRAGVEQYVHVSGIGADAESGSAYIRSRGQGELAVRAAYPGVLNEGPDNGQTESRAVNRGLRGGTATLVIRSMSSAEMPKPGIPAGSIVG